MYFLYRLCLAFMMFSALALSQLRCGAGGDAAGTDRRAQFAGNRGQGEAEAVPVDVVTVRRDTISDYILKNTALEAERTVEILSKSTGFVETLNVEEGMRVGKDQILAEMEDEEQKIALQEAEIALQNAKMNFERSEKMVADNLISKETFENSKFLYEQAKAQHDRANLNLEYTKIRAPFAGTIITRLINIGDMVRTNVATFTISDYSTLLGRIYITERDIRKISINQPATITTEVYPGRKFIGKVRLINPAVDSESGTVKVTVELKGNQDLLQPGMFCAVTLVTEIRSEAVIIPKKALVLESQEDMVFVYDNGVARRKLVTIGLKDNVNLEILSGLEVGDEVITVGQEGLRDGAPVNDVARANKAASHADGDITQKTEEPGRRSSRNARETGTSPAQPGQNNPGTAGAQITDNTPPASSPAATSGKKSSGDLSMIPDERLDEILAFVFSSNPDVKKEYDKRTSENPDLKTDARQKREFLDEMMQRTRRDRELRQ